jgi:hypothetical protein
LMNIIYWKNASDDVIDWLLAKQPVSPCKSQQLYRAVQSSRQYANGSSPVTRPCNEYQK